VAKLSNRDRNTQRGWRENFGGKTNFVAPKEHGRCGAVCVTTTMAAPAVRALAFAGEVSGKAPTPELLKTLKVRLCT
jgi:hypothetical protein